MTKTPEQTLSAEEQKVIDVIETQLTNSYADGLLFSLNKLSKDDVEELRLDYKEKLARTLLSAIRQAKEEGRALVRQEIYQLDWIKILSTAIFTRPTSWNDNPIREWRNASDEVLGSMMIAAEEKGIFLSLKERIAELTQKEHVEQIDTSPGVSRENSVMPTYQKEQECTQSSDGIWCTTHLRNGFPCREGVDHE